METNGLRVWGNCVLRRGSWVHCSHTSVAMWLRGKPAFGHRLDGDGRFWSAECSLRIRRIIFRSIVWSALLTGWETLLPSRADCKAFDKFTACKGRSLMRGKASGRWIDTDGTKRYHALTNAEVLRWLKLVPTHFNFRFVVCAGGRPSSWIVRVTRLYLF